MSAFLRELRRIVKPGALLILDEGRHSRAVTKTELPSAGSWDIVEETTDHLTCRPRKARG